MLIANPIYDVVFKYMMEDLKVAKTFISAIIGEKVEKLDFCPQEFTTRYKEDSLTVIRMDFLARIRTPDGYKAVIIEMQKAQLSSDIRRFRRYLGSQYQSESNIYTDAKKQEHARRIYCIFFLGQGLEVPDVPVLTVTNIVKDRATGKELHLHDEFIDSLHHQSWIVQISNLKKHRRDDLEKLLSIFDQNNIFNNNHILKVNEADFPKEYRHIIRRLIQAAESKEVAEQMKAEDELIYDFQMLERRIAEKEEVIAEKEEVIAEKEEVIEGQNKQIEESHKQIEANHKQIEESHKQIEESQKQIEESQKQLEEKDKQLEESKKLIAYLQSQLNQ